MIQMVRIPSTPSRRIKDPDTESGARGGTKELDHYMLAILATDQKILLELDTQQETFQQKLIPRQVGQKITLPKSRLNVFESPPCFILYPNGIHGVADSPRGWNLWATNPLMGRPHRGARPRYR